MSSRVGRLLRRVPRDASEDQLHEAVAQFLAVAIAPPGERSEAGVLWFSVEHRNARSEAEGAARKRRGVVAGIPDVWVFHASRMIPIELKTTTGRTSAEQIGLHGRLAVVGTPVEVCRTVEAVAAHLEACGVPMRRMQVAA
jgi:hypothetical protein